MSLTNYSRFLSLLILFLMVALSASSEAVGADCFVDLTRAPVVRYCPASPSNFSRERRTAEEINYIVIHTVQGSLESAIHTFSSSDLDYPRSAHYTIGKSGEIIKSVPARRVAWHAGTSEPGSGGKYESRVLNGNSIGIEHAGFVEDPNFPTPEQYYSSAALTRYLCELYDVPMDREHIVGHEEIKWAKGDPGPQWNWDYYMKLVRVGSREPVTPVRASEEAEGEIRTGNFLSYGLVAVGAALVAFGLLAGG